jgi:uncharacterized protein (TIGR01777 family)
MSRILIGGSSGLIGSALRRALEARGDEVFKLVRRLPEAKKEVHWDPMRDIPADIVSGFDAVVHLSGESVAGRGTAEKKRRIRESRVVSTTNLSRALAMAEKPPKVFLCASAIGYYGSRGEEVLTESSSKGGGFLSDTCAAWENATKPAGEFGIHVANLRFGIVLGRDGGALKPMLLPFRLGLGGRIGDGSQWWSWIHIEDAIAAIVRVLDVTGRESTAAGISFSSGPVNVVSPAPVTNAEFTRALAGRLKRPAFFRVPAWAVRLAFAEFADEGLLASARVMPKKLVDNGFEFRYPDLALALSRLLT